MLERKRQNCYFYRPSYLKVMKGKRDLIINPDSHFITKDDLAKNYEININHNNSLSLQELLEHRQITARNKDKNVGKKINRPTYSPFDVHRVEAASKKR